MTENPILLPDAKQDIAEAYNWYEGRHKGLGEEFLHCVEACLLSIMRHPKVHPFSHDQHRRALLRRFPYAIFYEYENNIVTVYSVFHCSQDPKKWHSRLS